MTPSSFFLHICQGLWFSFLRLCTSFVRITNLPRVFVRSYRELEITKVTPTHKRRNFFRVELLTGNNTTSVLDTPQKTESEIKSGRRFWQVLQGTTLLLYSTHLRKPNQRLKAEDALHSSVTDISGKLIPILNCGQYHAISVWSRTSVPRHSLPSNEARPTSSPGRFSLAAKPGKSALGTRLEGRVVCSNKDININAK